MQKHKVEIKEQLSEIVEIEANSEEEAIEKVEKQYNDKTIVLEPDSYKCTDFEIYKDDKEKIKYKGPFEIYDSLPFYIKVHILDLQIVNSIRSYEWEEAVNPINNEIEKKLFDVIKVVREKDGEHLSSAYIADQITEAYAKGKISLNCLENANRYDLLECVSELMDFEDLKNEKESEEQEV